MKKTTVLAILVFVGAIFLLACGQDSKPAAMAVKAAEEAVNAAKTEAAKYVPDQVKSLEESLAALKGKFDRKEYKAVVTEAQELAGRAKQVTEAAKLKKEELTASWTSISQELPGMVERIQSKVDLLSQARKLPAELSTEKFDEAKAGLAAVKEEWARAMESFKTGNVADAVASAQAIREKAKKTMEILGLTASVADVAKPETPSAEKGEAVEQGGRVKWLQKALNQLGADPKLAVDGRFGPATRQAVMKFQTAVGIAADGKASPETEAAIRKKLAGTR